MMRVTDIVNTFIDTVKANCTLENTVYITAYPNTPKSSNMKNIVAAFSLYTADTVPSGLGADVFSGQIKVLASVYVPFNCKAVSAYSAAEQICTAICSHLMITGVQVMPAEPDADTECMTVRVIFTVDDEIVYKQEDA